MGDCLSARIDILTQINVIACRQKAREISLAMGFGLADQTRLATAISELARNALVHSGGGCCKIAPCDKDGRHCICVTIVDSGPGIADIDQAMQDGFTSNGGMGLGLPAAKRLVHEMSIESEPGKTIINIEMYLRS